MQATIIDQQKNLVLVLQNKEEKNETFQYFEPIY